MPLGGRTRSNATCPPTALAGLTELAALLPRVHICVAMVGPDVPVRCARRNPQHSAFRHSRCLLTVSLNVFTVPQGLVNCLPGAALVCV